MLGWFFQESPGPTQLLAKIPQEEPNYLAGYIKSRSPVSLEKICASIINQSKKLFTQSGSSDQSQLAGNPCSQTMILLLLKILRWLADENGHMTMPTTNESITRLVVQHGKSIIEDLLSNSKAALNIASPNLQMMSLALLSCPMDIHYGQARYAYAPQETYGKYQLLDYASIRRFESLLTVFTPKWTQQRSAQKYCPELGRFLHWLVHSFEAIHQRLTTARTNPSMHKRKRTDPGDIDHSGPSSRNNNETNATLNNLLTRSEHQIPENQISSPTNLHYNLISFLTSCSALAEVLSDLGKNNLAPILLKSLERITSLVSHQAEECEPRIRMYQSVQRGLDLLRHYPELGGSGVNPDP
ncbi:hypothetical protein PCANC_13823 [Puccinia coronata f. sp. avenae]|uniref:Uncharacterized protein n=1 Tax=Puccinia coronata f. sp. avenae TaxID=200324 RepID=A0A2N5UD28_9BASI|nr:hypothetical protein PCANC_13823 [Puccinia coronata f. sp. avenae]